jgi:hypothetical protein
VRHVRVCVSVLEEVGEEVKEVKDLKDLKDLKDQMQR